MRVLTHSSLFVVVLAIPLAGCGRTQQGTPPATETKQTEKAPLPDPVAEDAALSGTEVTLHVEGMV